ncbi:winged helix-turn-helix domain-containing protein [Actinoplanes sp. NPDC051470]|uniref:ArsR/SmtB family transcription factor n=1 Tax=unclassified Actinoplanes TaxID=2626549 RepID=UPI0034295438
MLRIHFTEDDLARIRLSDEPDPLWETLLSLHMLQERQPPPMYAGWRARVGRQLDPGLRPLLALAPPKGYSPDFLTPEIGSEGIQEGLDAIRHTSAATFRRDLAVLAAYQPHVDNRFKALAAAEKAAVHDLTGKIERYYETALQPYWMQIRAAVGATRVAQAKEVARGGLEALFAGLHPNVRWRRPVLELHGFAVNRDIRLNGRGLRLIPSFFCRQHPTVLRDPDLPTVLVYPLDPDQVRLAPARRTSDNPLAALIGRTRAAILEATADGCTTTELARRLGISPATASHHASVLRDAGLITTIRIGTSVLHTMHPRGELLVNQ